jgi:carbon starvation protein CstA
LAATGLRRPPRRARTFSPRQITFLMMAYGFIASVLPVRLLLEPRDYLSTHVKLIFYTMSAEVIHSRLVATLKTA